MGLKISHELSLARAWSVRFRTTVLTTKGNIMSDTTQSGLTDNAAGAIAYLTFIPAIVFLVLPPYNASPYVRFHAWQSILFNLVAFVVDIVVMILLTITAFLPFGSFGIGFGISHLVWLLIEALWFILWLVCLLKAVNGERFKLPIIGAFAEQLANK
jgi:uncharacterized membrane protein